MTKFSKKRSLFNAQLSFVILGALLAAACAQAKPKVTVSPEKVLHTGHVVMRGTGFTPKVNVTSHLRRPDGTEFPVLPMLTDDRGQVMHDIDTLILTPGIHEIWVVEDRSKVSSNVARFEVTLDQP